MTTSDPARATLRRVASVPGDQMLSLPPSSHSLWTATSVAPPYAPLAGDHSADVCVVGAGITGLTAALAFAERGASVIVLEAGQVGGGVTGHTTGKVSALHGLIYDELSSRWGDAAAETYAQAQLGALAHIRARVEALDIDCDLRTRTCFTYVTSHGDRGTIRDEVTAARAAGLDASFTLDTPLPYDVDSAISLPDQAEFHARRYLLGLAAAVTARGGRIAQQSVATGLLERRRPVVLVGGHRVTAGEVVIASHMPFLDRGAFFARLEAKRSYAIAVRTEAPIPEGMFISSGDGPTRSVRSHPDGDGGELLIIGGEGHVAGEHGEDTPQRYERLAAFAEQHFGATEVTHRWSSQDLQPADGLPYVGRLTPISLHTWVATGYRKWGLTAGTAAALALVDRIEGRPSKLATLLDSWRVTPVKSAVSLVRANAGTAGHLVGDRLRRPRSGSIESLDPGEGAIMRHDGQTVAASRGLDGELHAVSPDCTHLGCRVLWNRAERSWDCPCHGSRFAGDGKVLEGPATRPLIDRLSPNAD